MKHAKGGNTFLALKIRSLRKSNIILTPVKFQLEGGEAGLSENLFETTRWSSRSLQILVDPNLLINVTATYCIYRKKKNYWRT